MWTLLDIFRWKKNFLGKFLVVVTISTEKKIEFTDFTQISKTDFWSINVVVLHRVLFGNLFQFGQT